jgi:proline dehydrogenase
MSEDPTVRDLREQVKTIARDAAAEREEAAAVISETIEEIAATAEDAVQKVNDKYQTAAETIARIPSLRSSER